jgi:hypothetical protein
MNCKTAYGKVTYIHYIHATFEEDFARVLIRFGYQLDDLLSAFRATHKRKSSQATILTQGLWRRHHLRGAPVPHR